jgi:hypothetical protein
MKARHAFRILAALKALSVVFIPGVAIAGGSISATAAASVTILAPVTLTAIQGIDFGALTRPSNASVNTVALDTAGNLTISGSGDAARAASTPALARFNLVGQAGVTYSTTQSLTFAQAGLTNVSATAPLAANGALGIIPPSGVQELRFGGAFDLSAATPVQSYSGALSVTVNYN